jgi:hypothetical protein
MSKYLLIKVRIRAILQSIKIPDYTVVAITNKAFRKGVIQYHINHCVTINHICILSKSSLFYFNFVYWKLS